MFSSERSSVWRICVYLFYFTLFCIVVEYFLNYEGKMKSSRPSLRETRDKWPLVKDPDRSWCHRHISVKNFGRSLWLHEHRRQHTRRERFTLPMYKTNWHYWNGKILSTTWIETRAPTFHDGALHGATQAQALTHMFNGVMWKTYEWIEYYYIRCI